MSRVKLAPSILNADFARLGDQVAEAERAGADRIHVDVMDGHFVPNLSMGPAVVQSLRRVTSLPLEIHLMISDPDVFLDEFVTAGSDSLLVHWEGNHNLHRTVQQIRALGKRASVAINPATPSAVLEEIVHDLDQVLVMTVNPGFGHQQFLRTTLPKIERTRELVERCRPGCEVEVDGGIDATTAPLAARAGATVLVAGSAIFGDRDGVTAAMSRLRTALDNAEHETHYIRAGKCLPVTCTEVVARLRQPPTMVHGFDLEPNYCRFRISPDVTIAIGVNIIAPGQETQSQTAEMLGTRLPHADEMDAYERVLGDAMHGDATLFAREDYVEEAWRIVDPVLKASTRVYEYEPGTWGPNEADARISPPHGWRNPTVRLP